MQSIDDKVRRFNEEAARLADKGVYEPKYTLSKKNAILDSVLFPFLLLNRPIDRTFAMDFDRMTQKTADRDFSGYKRAYATEFDHGNGKKCKNGVSTPDISGDSAQQTAVNVLATFSLCK